MCVFFRNLGIEADFPLLSTEILGPVLRGDLNRSPYWADVIRPYPILFPDPLGGSDA